MATEKTIVGRSCAFLIKIPSVADKDAHLRIRRILTESFLLRAGAAFVLVTMFFFGTGCHLIFPFDVVDEGPNYRCTIHQIPCVHKPKMVSVSVVTSSLPCHTKEMHVKVGDRVYCDTFVPKLHGAGSFEQFKMATVIKPPFHERKNASVNWLQIDVHDDTQGFFLAYDDRVQQKPQWLIDKFDESKDPKTGQNHFITVTVPNLGGPTPGPFKVRRMRIYEWKNGPPKAGDTIAVPANASGYPQVPANPPLVTVPMYVPFFIPKYEETDLKNCNPSDFKVFTGKVCDPNEQVARKDLVADCDANRVANGLYNWKCDDTTIDCCDVGTCSGSQANKITMLSYTVSSVVEFVPAKSKATFTLAGEAPDTKQVTGDIHFEYTYNQVCDCMKQMRVNDMHVDIPNMNIKGVSFTDIKITLNRAGLADCDNWATQYGRNPCLSYTIPASEFSCNFNFKEDGNQRLILVDNRHGAAQVKINNATRQLEIKNITLVTPVDIDGDVRNLTIKFDLFGNFKNFAPHASGSESQIESECQELTNKHTIHLTASTSFDPNNTVPSPPVLTYEWCEDYGLPTQKSLGTGVDCYIKPGAMKFGVHQITLVVRDSFGVAGTDKFDVTVTDTNPPTIKAPKGFSVLSLGSGPMKLNLGKPFVYDVCQSGDVWVSNDAPEWFFPGVHTITWTADDGSSNMSQAMQTVYVYGLVPLDLAGLSIGGPLPPGGLAPRPAPGDYTITAGGADIWETTDQFFYAYSVYPGTVDPQLVTGDFTAVVRVDNMEPHETAHEWAKAGIMLRQGFEPESPHTMVIRSLSNGVEIQGRIGADEESWRTPLGAGYEPSDTVWLRLDRLGSVITASYFVGGDAPPTAWLATGSSETSLPEEVFLGLATTSHVQGAEIAVEYSAFHLGPYAGPILLAEPELPPDSPAGSDGYMGIREVIDNEEIPDQGACYASLASGAGTIVDYETPVLNIHDSDGNGNFGNDDAFGVVTAGHRDPGTVDDISLIARGTIHIPEWNCPPICGLWTFVVNSDDGFTLQFPGHDFISATNGEIANFQGGAALRYYGARGAADTLGVIELPPGDHPFWMTYHEGGGGSAVELYAATGTHAAFDPAIFRLVGHKSLGTVPVPGFCDEVRVEASQPGAWSGGQILNLDDAVNALIQGPTSMDWCPAVNHSDPDDNAADPDLSGMIMGDLVFPNNGPGDDDDFAVMVTGLIDIPAAGKYQLGFNSDDGASLQIYGLPWQSIVADATGNAVIMGDQLINDSLTGWSFTAGEIEFPHAGCFEFSALMYERGGGSFFELFGRGFSPITGQPDPTWHLLRVGGAGMMQDFDGLQLVAPFGQCFPPCHPDHEEWIAVGRPECWCYRTQCHGDADGNAQGSEKTGFLYVGTDDLNVLIPAWLVKEPPHGPGIASVPNGICADFNRRAQGSDKTGMMRVGTDDLNILISNWLKKQPPQGEGIPPDCRDCP